jgi:hypothetical protein
MITLLALLLFFQTPAKDCTASLDAASQALASSDIQSAADHAEKTLSTLQSLGKPYKNAGHYKRVELRLRSLLRRADSLVKDTPVDDRPAAQAGYDRLSAVHEQVLAGVMSKKE